MLIVIDHLTSCFPVPFLTGKSKNNKQIPQGISSPHLDTNPSVVLADETNLAVKGSFEPEQSGKNLFDFVNIINLYPNTSLRISKAENTV